ncbi:class I SAM-dependent rRNA methyltransferase [Fodinisporobacter ferrooxydans]|uniref:Class I SAM-dependent rRNA methyltransferase n=1 Tax=Fodinisporobacter ferrooxydans TaxID=2901836 RepID=A0ABY4CM54_9BACL|nr:class I SAM-dependent rRNA methyltransferase [Alicyclobacillaceae bacterium MYW30-H2]
MIQMYLRRDRRKRLEHAHPWIFKNEIERVDGSPQHGDIVSVFNHQGHFLAKGFWNGQSKIAVRILTYNPNQDIDQAFFTARIREAWQLRRQFLKKTAACRVIYGEADFLPGLIVDRYGEYVSLQIVSYGMERHKEQIIQALVSVLQPKGIMERNDISLRRLEGLEEQKGVVYGEIPEVVEIEENDVRMYVDLLNGQKTGYFFDQRENRAAIAPLCQTFQADGSKRGADVLECFCHTGSFTVHAAAYGARHITALDISEHAIDTAIRNVQLNGLEDRADFEFVVGNAFDELRKFEQEKRDFDVVILDPPAFAKSRQAVEGALRGYKEINLRGMKLVREGGFLVTASCSYHVRPDMWLQVIEDAAADGKKLLRLIEYRSAGKDHPVILGMEENDYLKFAVFQVKSRA